MEYNFSAIEKKYQKKWEAGKIFQVKEQKGKKKFYCLDMFPYPSGEGLHMGHAFVFSLGDIFARFKRLQGYNVLYPIGYDSLGLPAENAAIKKATHPSKYAEKSIANFMKQQKAMGWSYDWSRSFKTSDSDFYKWDQWIFLQMLKKGLAYRKKSAVNWCGKCQTVLANEQVINGKCWRHEDTKVEIKHLEQWYFKITNYAEELLHGLDKLDWPERAKLMQRNWIGKSHGTEILFEVNGKKWPIFTTRPDTIYGVTFMVVSAQHPQLMELVTDKQKKQVESFLKKLGSVSEKELEKIDKEGVFTGSYATNPLTKERIPIYAGNFVLADYGSGMVMAVPAHDQRDFEFAKKYKLDIKQVIRKEDAPVKSYLMGASKITDNDLIKLGIKIVEKMNNGHRKIIIPKNKLKEYEKLIINKLDNGFWNEYLADEIVFLFKYKNGKTERFVLNKQTEEKIDKLAAEFVGEKWNKSCVWKWLAENSFYTDLIVHTEYGKLINSSNFNELSSEEAIEHISIFLNEKKLGKKVVQYKLRDWLISRQRYWGTPIPIVYCESCAKRKIKILLLHGITGHSKENWFPWLKKEAEKFGVEFICPDLPDADVPTLENWINFLKPYLDQLDENSIIIGHSLGATTAFHLIKKLKKKIDKLILVAPTSEVIDIPNFRKKYQNEEYFSKETIDSIEKFIKEKINWNLVKEKTNKILYYFSKNDPYIDIKSLDYYKKNLGGEFMVFEDKFHFNEGGGIVEFPEILNELNLDRNLGIVGLSEKDLPVKLPEKVEFGKGNPLATNESWINTKCPKCKGRARRETDTMDTFVNSSWYFLRYCDPKNKTKAFDSEKANYWCPVDQYIGGPEHITMHLIYIRFYTKFLRDLGLLKFDEPALRYFTQGVVKGSDGNRMSKSRGNVVEPLDTIKKYGADSLRLYLTGASSPDSDFDWNESGIQGSFRFLNKVYEYFSNIKLTKTADSKIENKINITIKEVTHLVEYFKHNLAIIKIRGFFDYIQDKNINKKSAESFLKLLHVYCPFITEELWNKLGNKGFISLADWPKCDEKKINLQFEKEDQAMDKIVSDILNIIKIIESRGEKKNKVFVYVIPNEKQFYNETEISKRVGKDVIIFAVNDKDKYDPTNKSKNTKPGKPGIYLE